MKKIKISDNEIFFNIYNPGGNITALVIDNNYDKYLKRKINDYLLKKYIYIEQVGFIKNNNLEMAGGEFCVNASRCAIYYLKSIGSKLELNILNKKIIGEVFNENYVSIKYYIDDKIDSMITNNNIVNFSGISLIFLDKEENDRLLKKINNRNIKNIIKDKIKKIKIDDKAIGIVLVDDDKIYPFIWVKDIDTLYFETSCGSASIAYALLKYKKTKITNYVVKQPSEYEFEIEIRDNKDKIKYIVFKGIVEEKK